MTNEDLHARVLDEIEALHQFFVDWFTGAVPASDAVFESEFLTRFDENFVLVPPAGTILDFSTLVSAIRETHGTNPEFRIAIREATIRRTWDNLVLVTYEEWQRDALASTPKDNGRITSALLQNGDRLRWLHVHETWLPEAVMEAGPYDF